MADRPAEPSQLEPHVALPPIRDGRQPTGVICPECGGVVAIEVGGRRHIHFACRVGHAYSLEELLMAKERHLEAQLWKAVYLAEELADILNGLERARWPIADARIRPRRAQLGEHVETLRALIRRDRPASLGDPAATSQA